LWRLVAKEDKSQMAWPCSTRNIGDDSPPLSDQRLSDPDPRILSEG
jgi:hypothetical protein